MVDIRNIMWIRKNFSKEVHTEYYFNNKTWDRIKEWVKKKKMTWYIMTPANYAYFKHYFGARLTKSQLDNIMSRRAKWLAKNARIGLHIHFQRFGKMTYKEKEQMFEDAIAWGKKNRITFERFVPGWERYDKDIIKLCKKYKLKMSREKPFLHDFEL